MLASKNKFKKIYLCTIITLVQSTVFDALETLNGYLWQEEWESYSVKWYLIFVPFNWTVIMPQCSICS